MDKLVERFRNTNKFLQKRENINLESILTFYKKELGADIFVFGVNAYSFVSSVQTEADKAKVSEMLLHESRVRHYSSLFCSITKPVINKQTHEVTQYFDRENEVDLFSTDKYIMLLPVYEEGKQLGALVLLRGKTPFATEELLLCEHILPLIGVLLGEPNINQVNEEEELRTAFASLSYSETIMVKRIVEQINGDNDVIVVRKIANELGLSSSISVNALHKLESAGVIRMRSMGTKGTFIKINNSKLKAFVEVLQ